MNDYEQAIEFIKRVNLKEKSLSTGYRELDACLEYTPKGSLITIGGRPAMGKTSFMCGLALNMLKEDKTIFYLTLDLSKEILIRKLILMQAKIQPSRLHQEIFSESIVKELEDAANYLAGKNLEVEDKTTSDTDFIEKMIKRNNYDYIFIDCVQLMKLNKTDKNGLKQIVSELKRIAKENFVTIILTAEVSIELEQREDKRPMLFDLKGEGVLEHLSDVVIFLYREDYYDQFCKEFNNTELIVAKNKFGGTGSINMHFDEEFAVFEDAPILDVF